MRAPRSIAARIAATAASMSPSCSGSCAGSFPSRKRCASSTSRYPRRASTDAVVSETPSASASVRTSAWEHCSSCQVPDAIGKVTVRTASDGALAEKPWTWLNSRPVLKTLAALICSAGLACAAAPASTPAHLIAHGVTVSGIRVGGLTAEPARERINAALAQPIRISTPRGARTIDPARAGAVADVDAGLTSALAALPGRKVTVPVEYSAERAAGIVSDLAAEFDSPAVDATVIGADAEGPQFTPAKAGVAVDRRTMGAAIGDLLRSGGRAPLTLLTRVVAPKRTVAAFGPVIVVNRGANTLRLYTGMQLVRTFRVATGQSIYPTPSGIWRI